MIPWLREQIDRDERLANEEDADFAHTTLLPTIDSEHQANWETDRVRREVEAKRSIIRHCEETSALLDPSDPSDAAWITELRTVVAMLALPFSDRPGYRTEWRP